MEKHYRMDGSLSSKNTALATAFSRRSGAHALVRLIKKASSYVSDTPVSAIPQDGDVDQLVSAPLFSSFLLRRSGHCIKRAGVPIRVIWQVRLLSGLAVGFGSQGLVPDIVSGPHFYFLQNIYALLGTW